MNSDHGHLSAVGSHYDSVTDGWKLILGRNFHFGYFRDSKDNLETATRNLIEELAAFGPIENNASVLDIGCGIGEPAFHLHETYGCSVTGITLSRRGVEMARRASIERGHERQVTFELVDFLRNQFPAESFDVAWVMESSHLMADKVRLIQESFRTLKPRGCFLLSDMVSRKTFTAFDLLKWSEQLATLDRTFGKAKTQHLAYYERLLGETGFDQIVSRDITSEVFPTLCITVFDGFYIKSNSMFITDDIRSANTIFSRYIQTPCSIKSNAATYK